MPASCSSSTADGLASSSIPHADPVPGDALRGDVQTGGVAVEAHANFSAGVAKLVVKGSDRSADVGRRVVVDDSGAISVARHDAVGKVVDANDGTSVSPRVRLLHEHSSAAAVGGDTALAVPDEDPLLARVQAKRRDVGVRQRLEDLAEASGDAVPDAQRVVKSRVDVEPLRSELDAGDGVFVRQGLLLTTDLIQHKEPLRAHNGSRRPGALGAGFPGRHGWGAAPDAADALRSERVRKRLKLREPLKVDGRQGGTQLDVGECGDSGFLRFQVAGRFVDRDALHAGKHAEIPHLQHAQRVQAEQFMGVVDALALKNAGAVALQPGHGVANDWGPEEHIVVEAAGGQELVMWTVR
eukprot:scaffold447_cov307-Pinguiococcus_pyrenoidosus.AAC.44